MDRRGIYEARWFLCLGVSRSKSVKVRAMRMQLDDIEKMIERSAKLRLDWLDYEDSLIESFGAERGSRIADNMLHMALGELSLENNRDDVVAKLRSEFLALGVQADVYAFIKEVEQKCKAEIEAVVHARTLDLIGIQPDEILHDIKGGLLSLSIAQSPVGEERNAIQTQLVDPIMKSGKKRFDYESFAKRAKEEDPKNGEVRLSRVFERVLVLSAEIDDSDRITAILKMMMKPGTEPPWLMDLVDKTMSCCKPEQSALMAINIGFCKGKSVAELKRLVEFRLNN